MPVEQDSSGNIIVTGQSIQLFHLRQCIGALSIEVKTGMSHSKGSVLKLVQNMYGVTARTKKGALTQLEDLWKDITGEYPIGSERYKESPK